MYPMIQEAAEAVSDGVVSNGAAGVFIVIFLACVGLLYWRVKATKATNKKR